MKPIDAAINHYLDEYKRVEKKLTGNDLPWLKQIREAGLEKFATQGFPTFHDEDWKYTNVTPITKRNFNFSTKTETTLNPEPLKQINLDCYRLTFVNGHFAEGLSQISDLPAGTIITNLATAIKEHPKAIKKYLGKTTNNSTDSFIALNTSFINDGACILLPRDTILNKPIELRFINTTTQELYFAPIRNLIVAEENSQVIIIENYFSLNESIGFTNVVTELVLNQQAHAEHYKLLQENEHTFHISTLQVHQKSKSCFTSNSFACGGTLVRSDTNVALTDEYAECTLNGLYLVHSHQHIDHHTFIDHAKPHGISRESYKGVIAEKGRAVFNGKVLVQQGAFKTDAQQANKNLLLSADAEIDTKPQLEIYADDVKCAHGATVGQLDETSLFYLQSRGIPKDEAHKILIYAFAREIIERIPLQPIREVLQTKLNQFI